MTHNRNLGRKLNLTDAERKRRSDLAKQLNRERRFGGAEIGALGGQGKKRAVRQRAASYVKTQAQRNPRQIWRALLSGLDESNPPATRVKAAQAILQIEREDEQLALNEAVAYEKMKSGDLVELILHRLSKAQAAGKLSAALPILEASTGDGDSA